MNATEPTVPPIEHLQAILDRADYIVRREPVAPDTKVEQLFVALMNDPQDRMYLMELVWLSDFDAEEEKTDEPETGSDLKLLQFSCTFPFTITQDSIPSVLRVLNFVNQSFPLGYFFLIETTGTISYKYVYAVENTNDISEAVVLEVASMVEMAAARLGPLCERVSLMDMTGVAVMQDIADRGLFLDSPESGLSATP